MERFLTLLFVLNIVACSGAGKLARSSLEGAMGPQNNSFNYGPDRNIPGLNDALVAQAIPMARDQTNFMFFADIHVYLDGHGGFVLSYAERLSCISAPQGGMRVYKAVRTGRYSFSGPMLTLGSLGGGMVQGGGSNTIIFKFSQGINNAHPFSQPLALTYGPLYSTPQTDEQDMSVTDINIARSSLGYSCVSIAR